MTPLAHAVARDLLVPTKDRQGRDTGGILALMSDIHCFDLTEVWDMAVDLARRIDDKTVASSDYLTFLPAPRTWLEVDGVGSGDSRTAYLLVETPSKDRAEVYSVVTPNDVACKILKLDLPKAWWGASRCTDLALRRPHLETKATQSEIDREMNEMMGFEEQALLYAMLLLVNSPKVIGRRQHMPHRGLERKLVSRARRQGGAKFAVNAWTEITLHVATHDVHEEGSHETHLTGRRALHWVRTFGRIRLGKLEIVRSHWRGSAELGIKQSRYTVKP